MKPSKYDAYNKINATINSCQNFDQLSLAGKMVRNFCVIYGDGVMIRQLWDMYEARDFTIECQRNTLRRD
jgi:hypothetical protein